MNVSTLKVAQKAAADKAVLHPSSLLTEGTAAPGAPERWRTLASAGQRKDKGLLPHLAAVTLEVSASQALSSYAGCLLQ